MKDQIEVLTHERTQSDSATRGSYRDLSVQAQEQRNALLDRVADEQETTPDPAGGPGLARFETALSWIAYAAVIVVAILVTWWAGRDVMRYLSLH
jgi:hypothetical protein